MYFIQLKKRRFFYLFLVLIIVFGFLSAFVKAEVDTLLPDEKNLELTSKTSDLDEENYRQSDDEVFDYESFRASNDYKNDPIENTRRIKKNSLEIRDSAFTSNKPVTLKDLVVKVFFIILVLLGTLLAAKVFLFKHRFQEPGNVIDNFVQKFASTFSNNTGLKLKQTLILTPGQNLYVVEIDGKRLLLGGTHQGGVQFLADLTSITTMQSNLEFKQIQENNNRMQEFAPFNVDNFTNSSKDTNEKTNFASSSSKSVENPFVASNHNSTSRGNNGAINQANQLQSRQPFKKRVNFRQSLLSNVK